MLSQIQLKYSQIQCVHTSLALDTSSEDHLFQQDSKDRKIIKNVSVQYFFFIFLLRQDRMVYLVLNTFLES